MTVTVWAYLRVSTDAQDVDAQRHGIRAFAESRRLIVDQWIEDTASGRKSWRARSLGELITTQAQPGDTLIVAEVSRLARSTLQCLEIFQCAAERGISLLIAKQHLVMDGSTSSKITAFVFALAAEIERDLIAVRTREGLAAASARGAKLGRQPGADVPLKLDARAAEIRDLLARGVARAEIARLLTVSRSTLYRWIEHDELRRQSAAEREAAELAARAAARESRRGRRAKSAGHERDPNTADWCDSVPPAPAADA